MLSIYKSRLINIIKSDLRQQGVLIGYCLLVLLA
jgi:hypothetical protein